MYSDCDPFAPTHCVFSKVSAALLLVLDGSMELRNSEMDMPGLTVCCFDGSFAGSFASSLVNWEIDMPNSTGKSFVG